MAIFNLILVHKFNTHFSGMLTPVFHIDQTPEYVTIHIYAPYANVKDTEAEYCDLQFFFISRPYFLKLYLPCELAEEYISGTYDCDKGKQIFKRLNFAG